MPTIDENRRLWNQAAEWVHNGDQWSRHWGSTEAEWWGTILPRIHRFVPAPVILEIGSGYGRWTEYLKTLCSHLILVDLNQVCIDACKARFLADSHITYHVNDGKSLDNVPERSVDVVFSFDSLVHAEADVIEAYLTQLSTILKPDGVGFIHHSNLAEYKKRLGVSRLLATALPYRVERILRNQGVLVKAQWRAESVSANWFAERCESVGLQCISQELVNWENRGLLIDCLSVFTPRGSTWAGPARIYRNPDFMDEAANIARLAATYMRPMISRESEGRAE
jgi:SAM-dependent methyltransferase